MMKLFLLWALLLLPVGLAAAQEIKMSQTAPLEQVYGETILISRVASYPSILGILMSMMTTCG